MNTKDVNLHDKNILSIKLEEKLLEKVSGVGRKDPKKGSSCLF